MAVWSVVSHSSVLAGGRVDAEFFRPAFLEAEAALTLVDTNVIARHFHISDGNHMKVSRHFTEDDESVPYYRGQDLNGFFLENANPVRISREFYDRMNMRRSYLSPEDVLICIVGAGTGTISLVTSSTTPCTGSCKIGLIRRQPLGVVDPYVLAAFLLGKFGQYQVARHTRGTAQGGLILKDICKLLVPIFPDAEQRLVRGLLEQALTLNTEANAHDDKSRQLLEAELGLDKLIFQKPVGCIAQFSEALHSRRIDADFFQTPFRQLDDHLDKYSTAQLHTLVDITKGIEVGSVAYRTEGYPFLRVSNIKETGIEVGPSDKYISPALYASLQSYRPQIGELLLTKDGSPGVAMAVDQDCDGIISGGVVRLKPRTDEIPIEYLALAINSRACRMQIERECSGALILHWKLSLIRKLRIPVLPAPVMGKIAELVTEAKQARRKSNELLDQAKARVEQLIEAAVQP